MGKHYIYIVLTRTNTIISRLIQMIRKDEYTHAAISLDEELSQMYSFGRKYCYNPFVGGFNREDVNKGVYKVHKQVPCVILQIEVSRNQYENARIITEHFKANKGMYKYNYIGLIYSLLQIERYSNVRFLCSEFVYHVLKESGIVELKISRNLIRPQNLLDIESKIIYKGDLKIFRYEKMNVV